MPRSEQHAGKWWVWNILAIFHTRFVCAHAALCMMNGLFLNSYQVASKSAKPGDWLANAQVCHIVFHWPIYSHCRWHWHYATNHSSRFLRKVSRNHIWRRGDGRCSRWCHLLQPCLPCDSSTLLKIIIARIHIRRKITQFPMRHLSGPRNHEDAGQLVQEPWWLLSWELCNFSMGMCSCFYPMINGNERSGCWVFPNTHFSTGLAIIIG